MALHFGPQDSRPGSTRKDSPAYNPRLALQAAGEGIYAQQNPGRAQGPRRDMQTLGIRSELGNIPTPPAGTDKPVFPGNTMVRETLPDPSTRFGLYNNNNAEPLMQNAQLRNSSGVKQQFAQLQAATGDMARRNFAQGLNP